MSLLDRYPWLETAWQSFARRAQADKLPHALLLTGPAGIGKLALAEDIARSALCHNAQPGGFACGDCSACRQFEAGTHPDYQQIGLEINLKTDKLRTRIVIEQVRDMADALALTVSMGKHRVAVMETANLMNANAANALLKTLEEPPPRTLILLVTARPDWLPATVVSRCQHLVVGMPEREVADRWLKKQGITIEGKRRLALGTASGSPGMALDLAESGALDRVATLHQQLERIFSGRMDPLAAADEWSDDELPRLARWMAQVSADLIRCAMTDEGETELSDSLADLTRAINLPSLFETRDAIHQAAYEAEGTIRKDLLRDELFLAWGRCAAKRV